MGVTSDRYHPCVVAVMMKLMCSMASLGTLTKPRLCVSWMKTDPLEREMVVDSVKVCVVMIRGDDGVGDDS